MTNRRHVPNGQEFLKGTATSVIKQRCRKASGKAYIRYNAARLRRHGFGIKEIADEVGRSVGSVFNWLYRMEQEGLDAVHDAKSPGRPPKLSEEQQAELKEDLCRDPVECGFNSGIWTARMAAEHAHEKFGVKYGNAGMLALAHRLGFSVRMPRSVPYNTPSQDVIDAYLSDTKEAFKWYLGHKYTPFCMDSAGIVNSPQPKRGLRRAGAKDVIGTNYSKQTLKVIGALGVDVLHIRFQDRAESDNAIAMLEELRQKYGRVLVVCDNAKAHKSQRMNDYLNSVNGDVVLWYLPPHTPQHNPIEIQWRELKRALGCRYFKGGFEEMKTIIQKLLDSGEVATVKLLHYMLEAIDQAAA